MEIVQNFSSSMGLFLDDRQGWDSLAVLQANTSVVMPDGFRAYCKAEAAWYKLSCTDAYDISTYNWTLADGSTEGLQTQMQFDTMPAADVSLVGKIYQYIGATTADFTHAFWYQVIDDPDNPGTYIWSNVLTQKAGQTIQYDTMPVATDIPQGSIIQFIGAPTGSYITGFFYINEEINYTLAFAATPFATIASQYKLERCGLGATTAITFSDDDDSWMNGSTPVNLADWGIAIDDGVTPADGDTFDIVYTSPGTVGWINQPVQPEGTGGGSNLPPAFQTEFTPTVTVPGTGISPDKTYAAGDLLESFIRDAFCPPKGPEFTISINPAAGLKEVGTSVIAPVVTVAVTSLGTAVADSITIDVTKGGTAVDVQKAVPATGTYTFTDASTVTVDTTYVATVSWLEKVGEAPKTATKSVAYRFVSPSYSGIVNVTPDLVDATLIATLTKNLKDSAGYTYNNITMTNQRICYAFPADFGTITSVKDGNNFEVFDSFTSTTVVIDTVSYTVMTSTRTASLNNGKMIFS